MRIKSQRFAAAMKEELFERRRRMKRLLDGRREEVFLKVPELREISGRMKSIAFDMGREAMGASEPAEVIRLAGALVDEQQALMRRKLSENGFPDGYLDEQYVCPICHDTGRIGRELCRCVMQLAIDIAFSDSGINPNESFANFNLELQRSPRDRCAMGKLRDAAEKYADSFPDCERRDLLYFGKSGVGKTYLLNCIGGRVLERGYAVLKLNAYRLIQNTLDNLRTDPDERPDYMLPDLLIIDDLGTEPMIPNITIETLLSILCQRRDANKATAFATNLDIGANDEFTASIQSVYGERFASRLLAPREVRVQAVRTSNVRFTV